MRPHQHQRQRGDEEWVPRIAMEIAYETAFSD